MRTWRPDRVQPSIISSQVQSGTLPPAQHVKRSQPVRPQRQQLTQPMCQQHNDHESSTQKPQVRRLAVHEPRSTRCVLRVEHRPVKRKRLTMWRTESSAAATHVCRAQLRGVWKRMQLLLIEIGRQQRSWAALDGLRAEAFALRATEYCLRVGTGNIAGRSHVASLAQQHNDLGAD